MEPASIPKSNPRLKEPSLSTQAKPVRANKTPKIRAVPYPGAARILDRPYQNLSGRRHVPVLVNANRVPFLRIKKPQPPLLSRIIRNIIKTRNLRILSGERLAKELPFAQDEEEWDHILYELAGVDSRNLLEPRWHHEVKQAIDDNHRLQVGAIQKRADVSAKMYAIVEKEKALAQEEKLRIRDEKRGAYKARRLVRKGLGDSDIQKGLDSQMEKTVVLDAPTMTEDVLNQDQQEVRPLCRKVILLKKAAPEKEVLKQGRQEDQSLYTEKKIRKRSDNFKTPDELKQLYEASLRPKTDEEIAKIKDARARRKEEESERKAQKLKRKQEAAHMNRQEAAHMNKQEAAHMEQKVNEEVEDPTTERVGPKEVEGLDEALLFSKPPVDPVARRMDTQLQPEVSPLLEEPRRESSASQRVDRRDDVKSDDVELDVLCQRLFQANFRGMQRSGQF